MDTGLCNFSADESNDSKTLTCLLSSSLFFTYVGSNPISPIPETLFWFNSIKSVIFSRSSFANSG